jgi:hypothetical protein
MNKPALRLFWLMLVIAFARPLHAQHGLAIQAIHANDQIVGTVGESLPADKYGFYKVVVYVHTDRWYVHPYAGQGQGLSWADIEEGGRWSIPTVQRRFKANAVAALLVKRNYAAPSTVDAITSIPHRDIDVERLTPGSEDYGKL